MRKCDEIKKSNNEEKGLVRFPLASFNLAWSIGIADSRKEQKERKKGAVNEISFYFQHFCLLLSLNSLYFFFFSRKSFLFTFTSRHFFTLVLLKLLPACTWTLSFTTLTLYWRWVQAASLIRAGKNENSSALSITSAFASAAEHVHWICQSTKIVIKLKIFEYCTQSGRHSFSISLKFKSGKFSVWVHTDTHAHMENKIIMAFHCKSDTLNAKHRCELKCIEKNIALQTLERRISWNNTMNAMQLEIFLRQWYSRT